MLVTVLLKQFVVLVLILARVHLLVKHALRVNINLLPVKQVVTLVRLVLIRDRQVKLVVTFVVLAIINQIQVNQVVQLVRLENIKHQQVKHTVIHVQPENSPQQVQVAANHALQVNINLIPASHLV